MAVARRRRQGSRVTWLKLLNDPGNNLGLDRDQEGFNMNVHARRATPGRSCDADADACPVEWPSYSWEVARWGRRLSHFFHSARSYMECRGHGPITMDSLEHAVPRLHGPRHQGGRHRAVDQAPFASDSYDFVRPVGRLRLIPAPKAKKGCCRMKSVAIALSLSLAACYGAAPAEAGPRHVADDRERRRDRRVLRKQDDDRAGPASSEHLSGREVRR